MSPNPLATPPAVALAPISQADQIKLYAGSINTELNFLMAQMASAYGVVSTVYGFDGVADQLDADNADGVIVSYSSAQVQTMLQAINAVLNSVMINLGQLPPLNDAYSGAQITLIGEQIALPISLPVSSVQLAT